MIANAEDIANTNTHVVFALDVGGTQRGGTQRRASRSMGERIRNNSHPLPRSLRGAYGHIIGRYGVGP